MVAPRLTMRIRPAHTDRAKQAVINIETGYSVTNATPGLTRSVLGYH